MEFKGYLYTRGKKKVSIGPQAMSLIFNPSHLYV